MAGLVRAAVVLIVLLASMCLALAGLRGPAPLAATAPANLFSAERAFACVQEIAVEEHPAGTVELERVRAWIVARIQSIGLDVEQQTWSVYVAAWNERTPVERELVNLLVRIAPREQPPATRILFVAHYDSRPGCPGASDDGLGVAALLEAMRALRAEPPKRVEILMLLTDGEELGRFGAKQFVETQLTRERIDVVINLDSLGNRAPLQLIEIGPRSCGLVRSFLRSGAEPVGSSLAREVIRVLPNTTDFKEFARAGVSGLGFACVNGASVYHQPTDTPERLDMRALQHCGETVMTIARTLDEDGIEQASGNLTFFTLFGTWVALYPSGVDLGLAILAALVFVFACRRSNVSLSMLGRGLMNALLVWVGTSVAARLVWSLAQSLRWNDALRVSDERGLIAISVCGLGFAAWLARVRFSRFADMYATSLGACALWVACGGAACLFAPGAAFAFAIPALLIALAACARSERMRRLGLALALFAMLAVLAPIALSLHAAGRVTPEFGAVVTSVLTASLVPIAWPLICCEDSRSLRALAWLAVCLGIAGLMA